MYFCCYELCVCSFKYNTGRFVYHGREFNSSHDEVLDTAWMNKNRMNKQWRRNNLRGRDNSHLGSWFRIPVGKNEDSKSKPLNPCVAGALYKFSNHMNLPCKRKMFTLIQQSPSFGECVNSFLKCRGFEAIKSKSLCNIIKDTVPDNVYLVQISARFKNSYDNSHCIVIYNNKLYDINHTNPLPLTKDNLDLCCLGDDWKFHHVSRSVSFRPTKKMMKNLHWFNGTSYIT